MKDAVYWMLLGLALALALLLMLLARLVDNSRKRQTLRKLGLPPGSRLTTQHLDALHAFENTDTHLRKSFPKLSERQREIIARDVLRDRGIIPKKRKPDAHSSTAAAIEKHG
jgi:hypothetical protein